MEINVDTKAMDEHARFEHSFPLYRMHIKDFEGKVKRFVDGKEYVSLAQLRFAFKDNKGWGDLQEDSSLLCQILNSEFFEESGNISVHKLVLWGMLHCQGTKEEKMRVFYDVL